MTDREKLEVVRAEIHRLVDVCGYPREMANALFTFMDSLPNEPLNEDLETEKTRLFGDCKVRRGAFELGAQWHKQQMMKDAICTYMQEDDCGDIVPVLANQDRFKVGDKVKVIIIKDSL